MDRRNEPPFYAEEPTPLQETFDEYWERGFFSGFLVGVSLSSLACIVLWLSASPR